MSSLALDSIGSSSIAEAESARVRARALFWRLWEGVSCTGSAAAARFLPKDIRGGTRGEGSSGRGSRTGRGGGAGRMRATRSLRVGRGLVWSEGVDWGSSESLPYMTMSDGPSFSAWVRQLSGVRRTV